MTSKERRDRIEELTALVEAGRVELRDKHDDLTRRQADAIGAAIDKANEELHALLTEGANPCPNCGTRPVFDAEGNEVGRKSTVRGLRHEVGVKNQTKLVYEVGCINAACRDHRAVEFLPELAVERWNDGDFDVPSAGPGVRKG
jgi:hypothetical protein